MSELNQLPEAPASVNFFVMTHKGYKLQFTLRDFDEDILLHRLREFFPKLEELKITPVGNGSGYVSAPSLSQQPPDPRDQIPSSLPYDEDEEKDVEVVRVETLQKAFTPKGGEYLLVFGGPWMKYGVKAWPEVAETILRLNDLESGKDYHPPAGATHAWVQKKDGKPQKVIKFGMS